MSFHIYADDNDNCFPFKPEDCDQNLAKLRNGIAAWKIWGVNKKQKKTYNT